MYEQIVELYCLLSDIAKELKRAVDKGMERNRAADILLRVNECNFWHPDSKKHYAFILSDAHNTLTEIQNALETVDRAVFGYEARHLGALMAAMARFERLIHATEERERFYNEKRDREYRERMISGFGY